MDKSNLACAKSLRYTLIYQTSHNKKSINSVKTMRDQT